MFSNKLLMLLLIVCLGCAQHSDETAGDAKATIVMIDLKTRQTFKVDHVDQYPATNPETGKKTLMPALYCPACQQWYPIPPLEETQRNPQARKCPKDGGDLVTTGPTEDIVSDQ